MAKTTGEMIDAYIKVRDKKKEIGERHKEELAPYNDALFKLEAHFQKVMDEQGLESLKCEEGTAYQTTQTSVGVADWDAFLAYVQEHDAWHMFDKRANKTAVTEVLDDTGELPPGLNLTRSIKVNVRRG